jgi:hypothetical protein
MNRDELLAELQEQARLVGMGAERELALMAQVQRLERVNAELLEALEDLLGWQTLAPDDVVAAARAAIAKAIGEK